MAIVDRGNYKEEEEPFDDLGAILNYLLRLRLPGDKERDKEFWSLRGQRKEGWNLSIAHHSADTLKVGENDDTNGDEYDKLLSQYKKRMLHSREHDYLNEKSPWWWLFFAKHHNLHTRLLDWTSNPLVAIYLAVENIISNEDDSTGGAIWALKVNDKNFRTTADLDDRYRLDPSSGRTMDEREWFMINPDPVTPRIVLQSGKFTYHTGNQPKPIDQMERRPGEELIKIKINPKGNAGIRKRLGIMNIHHASLFPSPTGIAFFVNSEWPVIAKY